MIIIAAAASAYSPLAILGAQTRPILVVESRGRKVTERIVIKLQRSRKDSRAVGGALRRLDNYSKAVQIQTLQHLLDQQDWELALPMYKLLREKEWYQWNPSLHAKLVAILAVAEQSQEAQLLVLETPESLGVRAKLDLQVCLIENYAKCGLSDKALLTFQALHSHSLPSAGRLSYRALLKAYIGLNLLHEAYQVLTEMKSKGFSPSLDDYKALLYAFGRGGYLVEMENLVSELCNAGMKLDRSGFNMMLSVYGQANQFDSVIDTLERMHRLNISCSVNSRNAISKSCPTLISLFGVLEELPQSASYLLASLEQKGIPDGELNGVKELLSLGIPSDSVKWEQSNWELDLHHMFLGTAYIALFLWLHQLKAQWMAGGNCPLMVRVVTGWGKNSDIEVRSVVKRKVVELLVRMKSSFKTDSHNSGVIISRGSALKAWLTSDLKSTASGLIDIYVQTIRDDNHGSC